MPGKGKKKYSKKQMKIARVAEPRDRITGADFRKLRQGKRRKMAKLCPRGKAAAKRKFKVYPSAYANMYASAVCSGKITPGGKKKKKKKR